MVHDRNEIRKIPCCPSGILKPEVKAGGNAGKGSALGIPFPAIAQKNTALNLECPGGSESGSEGRCILGHCEGHNNSGDNYSEGLITGIQLFRAVNNNFWGVEIQNERIRGRGMLRPRVHETRNGQKVDSAPGLALLSFCYLFEHPNAKDSKSTQRHDTAEAENWHNASSPVNVGWFRLFAGGFRGGARDRT